MSSSIQKLKRTVTNNLINVPGFRSKRKLVIIESDDWGSIRMPSKETYESLISQGFDIVNSEYNRLDSLESNEDLVQLYETLSKHTDSVGNHPVITANCIVGNPDFNKIKESNFGHYYYEPVAETLAGYSNRDKVLDLWKEGHHHKLFHPQFHGREHVNVVRWMDALKKRTKEIMVTFDHRTTFSGDGDYNFMEVLDYNTPDDLLQMNESLKSGLDLFEETFGFRSKSFIPPCYVWDNKVEKTLAENGVHYIQGMVVQSIPTGSFGNYKHKYHYLGEKNNNGQLYLIRNCYFEPSISDEKDPVSDCLRRINIAFKWYKPAIISSHRINFMGSLDRGNRENNLRMFNELLASIVKIWPDVEFMTSDQLGDLIAWRDEKGA